VIKLNLLNTKTARPKENKGAAV